MSSSALNNLCYSGLQDAPVTSTPHQWGAWLQSLVLLQLRVHAMEWSSVAVSMSSTCMADWRGTRPGTTHQSLTIRCDRLSMQDVILFQLSLVLDKHISQQTTSLAHTVTTFCDNSVCVVGLSRHMVAVGRWSAGGAGRRGPRPTSARHAFPVCGCR